MIGLARPIPGWIEGWVMMTRYDHWVLDLPRGLIRVILLIA